MVEESVVYRDKVIWFTTLLGFKHHLKSVKALLGSLSHQHNVTALKHTTFEQGRTCRWGIAWSFFEGLNENGVVEVKFEMDNWANVSGRVVKDFNKYVYERIVEFIKSNYCKEYRMQHKIIGGNCIVEISPKNGQGVFCIKVEIGSNHQISFVLVPKTEQDFVPLADLKTKENNFKFDFYKIVDH